GGRDLSVQDLPVPGVELERPRHPALQGDIPELVQARQLADVLGLVALPILDDGGGRGSDDHLAEACHLEVVDLDTEAEVPERILPGHAPPLLDPATHTIHGTARLAR